MTRRKSVCSKWTLVLLLVLVCPYVYSRPQESAQATTVNSVTEKATENPISSTTAKTQDETKKTDELTTPATSTLNIPRNVKTKSPVIGESIKMVTSQLLETPSNATSDTPLVSDTRIPPKIKNQVKHKIKTRNEEGQEPVENSHAGVAVPITMEELEKENKVTDSSNESSTSNEGISTWILLSNPANATTEPTKTETAKTEPMKTEEPPKKQKPNPSKNKTKRPQNNKTPSGKRPIIGSINKADLVAGGSAINENVLNKIKDTVLSNVQKNKNTPQRTSTTTTTTTTTTLAPEVLTTKKEPVTKSPLTVVPVVKVTSKSSKKKNKNKLKTTTATPIINESALLPMEPKEQEIELEISTPHTTTKKPKRSSTKKKNKTKKRKPKPKPSSSVSEIKTSSNKTKSSKPFMKQPSVTSITGPITSQIYNYLSREVMPSVGVGMLGLASLVGLAGYFFYPFSTPVRRTFEVDKKDDIYRHNAEEYANEGNGQAEEEMLGTVLAGMPAHSKHKLNPYAGQTQAHVSRYPVKKEQDNIRYRHVANKYEPQYNVHYPQQKTGIAHGAVYPEPVNYRPQYETRNVYTTEGKYVYDKGQSDYTPHPAVEPIYAAPQTGPSAVSSYGNDNSNSVVYGVKPSSNTEFKPVYPFDTQYYNSETTSSPITYPPTSMYLGSNDESENQEEIKYDETSNEEENENKFVVGNVPKELSETATPAVVPEHGPRNLNRRKRGIVSTIEEILKSAKEEKDVFISNEIDEIMPMKTVLDVDEANPLKEEVSTMPPKEIYPVYAVSIKPLKEMTKEENKMEEKATSTETPISTLRNEIIESVSTVPIDNTKQERTTTDSEMSNELETTTKTFRVYEVFSSVNPIDLTGLNSLKTELPKLETTTLVKNVNTETTTETKSETTSTMPPSPSSITDPKVPSTDSEISTPKPTNNPEVLTYPPLNQDSGFFTFLKRLIEFKYRLGLSILQTTSENLNRYLRNMESSAVSNVARASRS